MVRIVAVGDGRSFGDPFQRAMNIEYTGARGSGPDVDSHKIHALFLYWTSTRSVCRLSVRTVRPFGRSLASSFSRI